MKKRSKRISTVIGVEGWEEKPAPDVAPVPDAAPVPGCSSDVLRSRCSSGLPDVRLQLLHRKLRMWLPAETPKEPAKVETPAPAEAPERSPAKVVPEANESFLLNDVEDAVATSKVVAELERARAAYSDVTEVMTLVDNYEMQLANLKEQALDAGDTVQLEANLETLYQDWLNTFPNVLKEHDEKVKQAEAAKAAGVAPRKVWKLSKVVWWW